MREVRTLRTSAETPGIVRLAPVAAAVDIRARAIAGVDVERIAVEKRRSMLGDLGSFELEELERVTTLSGAKEN